jgi:hypothetical protein
MEPDTFEFVGGLMLVSGFGMAVVGGYFFGQVYFCGLNPTSCPLSISGAATQIGFAIPLLLFGTILIPPGAIFVAAGHITEHLRPSNVSEVSEVESPKPLRSVLNAVTRSIRGPPAARTAGTNYPNCNSFRGRST